jgi:putative transcriptional regulator
VKMLKSSLVETVVSMLSDSGFGVVDCRGSRSSFDVIGKRGGMLLLVKALSNIEGLSRDSASDLKGVAQVLDAVPVVVSERMKSSQLSDGVVYDRYGVCVSTPRTFGQMIQDTPPKVYSTRGNYCVHINAKMLSEARGRLGLTQEALAQVLGVSKQSVYRYERSGSISLDVFECLNDLFEDDLLDSHFNLEISQGGESAVSERKVTLLKRRVCREFRSIGFNTVLTAAPFDLIASRQERVFSVVSNDWRRLREKLDVLEGISDLVGGYSICISERKLKGESSVLSPAELAEIKTPRELFKLLSY